MNPEGNAIGIEVKVTDRCNQRCAHCANGDGPDDGRDLDEARLIARLEEWARMREDPGPCIKELRLTGGEPLVRFEAVLAIAEICRELGIRTGINTNGLLLEPDRVRRLKESGIDPVKVSFDTADPDRYRLMRGPVASLDPLLDGIRALVANRFKVILRFTLMTINRDELVAVHALAEELGVQVFQVKPLILSGRADRLPWALASRDIDEALRDLARKRAGKGPAIEVLCWPRADGVAFPHKSCGSIDKIYVTPALLVTLCNYIPEDRQAVLGDLAREPLVAILRRRRDGIWSKRVGGQDVLISCPNESDFFRGGS